MGSVKVTELYLKAADQLGSDKPAVRLVALHALEQLGQDEPAQRSTVTKMLCGYLRTETEPAPEVRVVAQRVLAEHARVHSGDRYWGPPSVDLTGATLVDVDFTECRFAALNLSRARLTGGAALHGIEVEGEARFGEACFDDDAGFFHARFSATVGFVGTRFAGRADFQDVEFGGYAGFQKARFSGESGFGGSHFRSRSSFTDARFDREVTFHRTQFVDRTSFLRTRFTASTSFHEAHFGRDADFRNAHFAGPIPPEVVPFTA